MSEAVGHQLGNFFGEFMEYDVKNNTSIWRESMRVKIRLDVRKPLKRKKKIKRKDGSEFVVMCKYERLGDFCFVCGLVSHTERFCRRSLDSRGEDENREWGAWLRAPPRRGAGQGGSKWLREEDDAEWPARVGRGNNLPDFAGDSKGKADLVQSVRRDIWREKGDSSVSLKIVSNQGGKVLESGSTSVKDLVIGLEIEETTGLSIEDRKRRRFGPEVSSTMDMNGGLPSLQMLEDGTNKMEAVFSGTDYTASPATDMATLAVQASRPL